MEMIIELFGTNVKTATKKRHSHVDTTTRKISINPLQNKPYKLLKKSWISCRDAKTRDNRRGY